MFTRVRYPWLSLQTYVNRTLSVSLFIRDSDYRCTVWINLEKDFRIRIAPHWNIPFITVSWWFPHTKQQVVRTLGLIMLLRSILPCEILNTWRVLHGLVICVCSICNLHDVTFVGLVMFVFRNVGTYLVLCHLNYNLLSVYVGWLPLMECVAIPCAVGNGCQYFALRYFFLIISIAFSVKENNLE